MEAVIQIVGIFLIVLLGSCVHSSSNLQTGYQEKYITNTYFEKHQSLIDSEFKEFIENEIPLGLCNAPSSEICAHLHSSIIGEGSHRRFSSSIILKLEPELKTRLTTHACKVIFIERLPRGVFADPFELQHLVQRGVFTDAAVFGDTNLELPSFSSNQSVVEIHMNIDSEKISSYADDLEVEIEVPLHARYQALGHGYSRVEFEQPDFVIGCEGHAVNKIRISIPSGKTGNSVTWEIPCGMKEHATIVSILTFGSAIVSTLLIVLASVFFSHSNY